MPWAEAAALPLALLTPEMHFRALVDRAFAEAGARPRAALETDSMLALLTAVQQAPLAAVLPGALVDIAQAQPGLQARALVAPVLHTPIAFLTAATARPTLALQAALALAQQADWLALAAAHSGALGRTAID
jgi:DNA-binding transcriptional LysR family regulator